MNTRGIFLTLLIVGVIVLVFAIALIAGLWYYSLPEAGEQVTDPSHLVITQPENDSVIFLGDTINVTGSGFILKRDVKDLALYVDSAPYSSDDQESPRSVFSGCTRKDEYCGDVRGEISWKPAALGQHFLRLCAVRLSDSTDMACSDMIQVRVLDPEQKPASKGVYSPQNDDDLERIAEKFGIPPELIADQNPSVDFSASLPPDTKISIPALPTPPPPKTPTDETAEKPSGITPNPAAAAPGKFNVWLDLQLKPYLDPAARLPSAPVIYRFKDGCDVEIYLRDNSDNETGFFIYRLNPGASSFTRIATIGPHTGGGVFLAYVDKGLYGYYQYYASSFNALGESASNTFWILFDDKSCLNLDIAYQNLDTIQLIPDTPLEKTYCYYSIAEGFWSRLPADPQAFFFPTNNTFDQDAHSEGIQIPSASSIAVECWGWAGGSLIPLGSGTTTLDSVHPQIELRGDHFTLSAKTDKPVSFPPPVLYDKKPKIYFSPPIDLTATDNVDTCINHFPYPMRGFFGPLFCKSAFETGSIVLVWDWMKPIFPIDLPDTLTIMQVDGYQVYKYYPGGKPVLIKTITDPDQTVLIQPAESSLKLPVFFVRAFRLAYTSTDSNHYPLIKGGSAAFITKSLIPTSVTVDTVFKIIEDCGGSGISVGENPIEDLPSDQIVVGYKHISHYDCIELNDDYYRGRVLFDLGAIKGPVSKAELSYQQGKGFYYLEGAPKTMAGQSCAKNLNLATSKDAFEFYETLSLFGAPGKIHKVDVTVAVRDWVSGTSNLGFVFTGRDEGFSNDYNECWSRYGSFTLNVTYFDLSK